MPTSNDTESSLPPLTDRSIENGLVAAVEGEVELTQAQWEALLARRRELGRVLTVEESAAVIMATDNLPDTPTPFTVEAPYVDTWR